MAETLSSMLPLGTPLPPTRLTDVVSGRTVDAAVEGQGKKGLLVAFVCNHCPFVKHIRKELVRVAHDALDRGFAVLAVSSNDVGTHPQDGPDAMRGVAQDEVWRFPYLYDETQEVAKAYHAVCTPDLFLFDAQLRLAYRGQFDDTRPGKGRPATGASLIPAINAVAENRAPSDDQRPSIGCNIKWKAGNEPVGFGRRS